MNADQAKQIPIDAYLAHQNLEPAFKRGHKFWYHSPLRRENTPSFKVDIRKNTWFDFGNGRGGTLIDLLMIWFGEDVSTVLARLSRHSGHFPLPSPPRSSGTGFNILKVHTVTHPALLTYLQSRTISLRLARLYLTELHYQREGRTYFSLAFSNRSGGHELRNKYFKGVLGIKDLTLIPASPHDLLLFEGFMDFLSYLTLTGTSRTRESALILNSTALARAAIRLIKQSSYRHLSFFFDNDPAGVSATTHIGSATGLPYLDRSFSYRDHKDLNDFCRDLKQKSCWGKRK